MTPLGFIITVVLIVLNFIDVVEFSFWQLLLPLTIGVALDLVFAILAVIWQMYIMGRTK